MIRPRPTKIGLTSQEVTEATTRFKQQRENGDRARTSAGAPAYRQHHDAGPGVARMHTVGPSLPNGSRPILPYSASFRQHIQASDSSKSKGREYVEEGRPNPTSSPLHDSLAEPNEADGTYSDNSQSEDEHISNDDIYTLYHHSGTSLARSEPSYVSTLFPESKTRTPTRAEPARTPSNDHDNPFQKAGELLGQAILPRDITENLGQKFREMMLERSSPGQKSPATSSRREELHARRQALASRSTLPRSSLHISQRANSLSPVKTDEASKSPHGEEGSLSSSESLVEQRSGHFPWDHSDTDEEDKNEAEETLLPESRNTQTPKEVSDATVTSGKTEMMTPKKQVESRATRALNFVLPIRSAAPPSPKKTAPRTPPNKGERVEDQTGPSPSAQRRIPSSPPSPSPGLTGRVPTGTVAPKTPRRTMQVYNDGLPASMQPQTTPRNRHEGSLLNPAFTAPARRSSFLAASRARMTMAYEERRRRRHRSGSWSEGQENLAGRTGANRGSQSFL